MLPNCSAHKLEASQRPRYRQNLAIVASTLNCMSKISTHTLGPSSYRKKIEDLGDAVRGAGLSTMQMEALLSRQTTASHTVQAR